MNGAKDIPAGQPLGFLRAVGSILKDVWNTAGTCGFCCGIKFDHEKSGNDMPTPSSCCGVRV
jgi:hypothetical protein